MATFQQAKDLMADVKKAARPVSIAEDRTLTAFARKTTGDNKLKLLWWDMAYWSERQKEAKFKVKDEELRQYLPLPSVKEGLWKVSGCGLRGLVCDGCLARLLLCCRHQGRHVEVRSLVLVVC
jgi:Zn-dependent oligopeptidase